jgi:hypothetical protein
MDLRVLKAVAPRYLILAPMAYCIYLLITSNEMYVRLAAIIALIVLEQVRNWSLLATARSIAKLNKP